MRPCAMLGTSPLALLALAAERAGGVDRGRVIYLGSFPAKSISRFAAESAGWSGRPRSSRRLALVETQT